MNEENQPSEDVSDETQATDTPEAETDENLGDTGKRTIHKLREEVKALKRDLAAMRDAGSDEVLPSDGTSDSAPDADSDPVATTDEAVKPTPLEFQGTADGGARRNPASTARQLSRHDIAGMSPRAIDEARRNGQLRDLLRGN